mgnify:CR=1 FL=1
MQGIFFNDFKNSYLPEILNEIYRDKIYVPYLENKKDLIVLDIGANIGLFSLYVQPQAKTVFALEPAKQHFEVLQQMISFNKLTNILPMKMALANNDSEATFYHNENTTMYSLKPEVATPKLETETVQVVTIENLFKMLAIDHVDFMKLDVEGSEMEIICGVPFKNVCEKIDSLVVEYHQWSAINPMQLVNALRDLGYKVDKIPNAAMLFGAKRI